MESQLTNYSEAPKRKIKVDIDLNNFSSTHKIEGEDEVKDSKETKKPLRNYSPMTKGAVKNKLALNTNSS